ncbi:MAG: hypothetical protein ABJJ03_12370 [Sulfitobacter sp.]
MKAVLHIKFHHAILALVTLAMLSLPFAHRVGAAPITPEVSQYLALGGALSDICGETDTQAAGGCESCRIVGAMLLPPATYAQSTALICTTLASASRGETTVIRRGTYACPPVRAPPRL